MNPSQKPSNRLQRMSLQPSSSLRYSLSLLLPQSGSHQNHPTVHLSALKSLASIRKPILKSAAKLSMSVVLPETQLKLLPRYLSETETSTQGATDTSAESIQPRKTWSGTENELDAFNKLNKPRKYRFSFIAQPLPSLLTSETPAPDQPLAPELPCSVSFEAPKRPTQPRKLFINLPKLPFGKHLAYNEETAIRGKIVTKRWKAWKRVSKPVPRPKRKSELYN